MAADILAGTIVAIIYSVNLNISPKMSYGVLECDIVMSQNDMPMIS